MEMSFTAEERGLLKQIFESEEDGQREAYTFEFIVDVFDVGRWLVEIEDPLSDMALDCEAEGDELTCSGECDGLSCTIHAVRAP